MSSCYCPRPLLGTFEWNNWIFVSCKEHWCFIWWISFSVTVPRVTSTCKSAFTTYLRFKIFLHLTLPHCTTIVHAFVTSKLDYCNLLLYGQPKCVLKRLWYVQNWLIYQSRKYDHVTPLLINLHWLPVDQRIKFKLLTITFKALHGHAPQYICDLLKHYNPSRTLHSSTQNLLCKPTFNLKTYSGHTFAVSAPTLWNSIPLEIRNSNSLYTFKCQLQTWLFTQALFNHV